MKNNKYIIRVIQIVFAASCLCLWEYVAYISTFWRFLIASPRLVAKEFIDLLLYGDFISHFFITGTEAILGLLLGTVFGSVSGLFLCYSEFISKIAKPYIFALGTLPIIAFAPLMIVWFGVGMEMKIAIACFSTLFVSFSNAYRGAKLVSNDFIDTLRGMNASQKQIFFKITIPGSLEWVLASIKINIGLALLGAFIGEFIASESGLGYVILKASGLYNIPRAFAGVLGIMLLAIIFDKAGRILEYERRNILQYISVPRLLWKNY